MLTRSLPTGPSLTRRGLLAGAGVAAAATLSTAGCTDDPVVAETGTPRPLDPTSWQSVREQFALAAGQTHMATFYLASHPASVRTAIATHRAGLDADPHGYLANQSTLDEAVAKAAATYLDTSADQIAFTDSTTMGLGLLYTGMRLRPGDEVLTTEHDFMATHESLRLREVRDGIAPARRVRLYDDPATASADEIVSRLRAALTRQTRIVAITWVHSSTGVKLPVRAIAGAVADANRDRPAEERALLCLDSVHGFGAEGTTPADLGCDFLVSGCHKWLFGPRGTGIVWGTPEAWGRYTPVIPTFVGSPDGPPGPWATPGGFHSFEHRWALAEAFALHQAVGPTRVAERTHQLATALKDGLLGISTVRLRTPRSADLSAGIVCCEVEGYEAREAVSRLEGMKVLASTTPYSPSYLRFGPSIINNESDVEAVLAAVRTL